MTEPWWIGAIKAVIIVNLLLLTVAYGAGFGLIWSVVGYSFTRGARDFSSVSQVVATKYEVFCEHKFAQQGRAILAEAGIVGVARTTAIPTSSHTPTQTGPSGSTPDDAPRTDPPVPPSA